MLNTFSSDYTAYIETNSLLWDVRIKSPEALTRDPGLGRNFEEKVNFHRTFS